MNIENCIKLDAHSTSGSKNEIITALNGIAPTANHSRAYAYHDALGRDVIFLDMEHDNWKNSLVHDGAVTYFTTDFNDDHDRLLCMETFRRQCGAQSTMLIFAKNIRGDKNYRFIGEFVVDMERSAKEDKWYHRRQSMVAAGATIVGYKPNARAKEFTPLT